MSEKRYQDCAWPIRLWRRRHYVRIPWDAIRFYVADQVTEQPFDWATCWGVATGLAQARMKWLYTMEEVERDLG